MATSSLLIVGLGTLIANKITIPFLGKYKGPQFSETLERVTAKEKKGLQAAGIMTLILIFK